MINKNLLFIFLSLLIIGIGLTYLLYDSNSKSKIESEKFNEKMEFDSVLTQQQYGLIKNDDLHCLH